MNTGQGSNDSLMTRLMGLLNRPEMEAINSRLGGLIKQPVPPAATETFVNKELEEVLGKGERLLGKARSLAKGLEGQIAALEEACREARVLSCPPRRVPLCFQPMISSIAVLLREDGRTAKMVASVIQSYQDACNEMAVLERALSSGHLRDINLDRSRGKFYHLMSVQMKFEGIPLLRQLFDS